jgi:hypothetical protein
MAKACVNRISVKHSLRLPLSSPLSTRVLMQDLPLFEGIQAGFP